MIIYYQGNDDPYILIGHFIYGELIVQPTCIVYKDWLFYTMFNVR